MYYTLLYTKDLATDQIVEISKSGNTYNVELSDSNMNFIKKFKTIEEASKIYNKIIDCFINGYYSIEQRIEIIKGESEAN